MLRRADSQRSAVAGLADHPPTASQRVLARGFLLASGVLFQSAPTLHPYWSGFWLGILPRHAHDLIDQTFYDAPSTYGSALHNLRGLFHWERHAIDRHFVGRSRLLVLGAGGGREVLALRALGFDAEGWECNPRLFQRAVRLAAAHGHAGVIHPGQRSRAPETSDVFEGAILGWSMYMHVPGRDNRVALLRRVRRSLPTGAPVLVSFFSRDGEDHRRCERVIAVAAPLRRLLRRSPPYPGDDLAPCFVHRFTPAQLAEELTAGGFDMLEWHPMGPGPYDSGWAVGTSR